MSKFTDVHDLLTAYQKQARKIPAKGVYASRHRQVEVNSAHVRRLERKRRRSVGKSNKRGYRFTAEMRVALICDMNFWALVCRSNRQNANLANEVVAVGIGIGIGIGIGVKGE